MGVDIAISARDIAADRKPPLPDSAYASLETIHFQLSGDGGLSSLPPLFAPDAGRAESRQIASTRDPVVQKLTRALEAAESSGDAFATLYADALRLAVVTRIISIHGRLPAARRPESEESAEEASKPRRPKSGLVKWRLKRVMAFIDEHLGETVTLADMAAAAGLSRMHFAAQFRIATGIRAHEYLLKRRIERAQRLLRDTKEPLAQIALSVGFQTQSHFTTVFRRFVDDTPYQWRCANAAPARDCAVQREENRAA